MLFAVDIGNTNVVLAAFEGKNIQKVWRIATDIKRTADEYSSIIISMLRDSNFKAGDFRDAVLSSVVPDLIGTFVNVCSFICHKKPFIVSGTLMLSENFPIHCPPGVENQLGTDLICNALAARNLFKNQACIAVDFGTALSIIATDSKGIIRGVSIAPGLATAVHSLSSNTAQLPIVPLKAPSSSLGLDTVSAIQSGVVLGYKGLVEHLVKSMKADVQKISGDEENSIKVVATGGLNSVLKPITDCFTVVEKDLTLQGLHLIFEWSLNR